MKISVEWINHFLTKPVSARQVADALEAAGVEVDGIIAPPKLDSAIIVGEVTSVSQHPNADRLRIAQVDVKKSTLEIVCGAPNLEQGQKVAVAQIGATLPDGTTIGAAKLRGVASQGMLCSESELGLSENHEGILVLSRDAQVGKPVKGLLAAGEVVDASTAANRWDLTSVIGLAREVAAQTGQKLKQNYPEQLKSSRSGLAMSVADPALSERYMLARLSVDRSRQTPAWMATRLQEAGMRSINLVVDITNYILLQYGQPLHAFDAAKIEGELEVRAARKGETLVTLDGTKRALTPDDIVIADDAKVVGLAGVKGGANSEIDDTTTEILLEAATFNPARIRKTAVRHGLRSDASARFERGVPIDSPALALGGATPGEGAIGLLLELAGGELLAGPADVLSAKPTQLKIAVRTERINRVLGLNLPTNQINTQLKKLGWTVTGGPKANELTVSAPWWRPDIQNEEDVAEEVIKLVGYDQLPATIPAWKPQTLSFDSYWSPLWQGKSVLRSSDLFEVMTYSFISEDQITGLGGKPKDYLKLKNPLSIEQAYLRTSLLPSLLRVLERNRGYQDCYGVFEYSKVYLPQKAGQLPQEPLKLGVMVRSRANAYVQAKAVLDRLVREFNVPITIKPVQPDKTIYHPTRSAEIYIEKQQIGVIGQLHPAIVAPTKIGGEVGYLEIDWKAFVAASTPRQYIETSKYPSSTRDITVIVDRTVTWLEVERALNSYQTRFVGDYYGDNLPKDKKTLTLRLTVSHPDHTPTDKEVDAIQAQVVQQLAKAYQATLQR